MLEVRVIGPLRIAVGGQPVEAPASRRGRVLLAWLALHPGLHARTELAARLRPDVLDESARVSLRQALWDVRRSLGGAGEFLSTRHDRIGLVPGPGVWVDAWEFEARLADGRAKEALELWQDAELLDGLDEDWVFDARDRLRQRLCDALAAVAAQCEAAGDVPAAIALTRRWTELEPLAETPAYELIRRLGQAGDRASAVTTYERLRERLQRELGITPSEHTRALLAKVRAGLTEPVRPAARVAPGATARRAGPALPATVAVTLGQSPLVGRAEELDRLSALWRQAASGARHCVLASGEPGIGKTRLLAEICREAHATGAAVLFGRCHEQSLVTYQPFVEALRRWIRDCPRDELDRAGAPFAAAVAPILPELAERLDIPLSQPSASAVADRFRLFEAVAGLLAAGPRPVLLAIDDLHDADRPTLALLRHLACLREPAPLLLLATYRSTELSGDHPLRDWVADIRREHALEELSLTGLDEAMTGALVAHHLGGEAPPALTGALRQRTGGNPYFVAELVRSLAGSGALTRTEGRWSWDLGNAEIAVPRSVQDVIDRRVRRLHKDTALALATAAVLGTEFEVETLQRLGSWDGDALLDALEEARAAHLLTELPAVGWFRFAHPLVQETLYEGLSSTRRTRLHARAAQALEARSAGPEELALHYSRAVPYGDRDKAIQYGVAAAEEAMRRLAFEAALEHFDRALGLLRDDERNRRRELLSRRGLAYTSQITVLLHPGLSPRVVRQSPSAATNNS